MLTLEDDVYDTITSFIRRNILFTSIEVINQVILKNPIATPKKVRAIIRSLFPDMQYMNYTRTPIEIMLGNGETQEILLYHHIGDTCDIDHLYDHRKHAHSMSFLHNCPSHTVNGEASGVQSTQTVSSFENDFMKRMSEPMTPKDYFPPHKNFFQKLMNKLFLIFALCCLTGCITNDVEAIKALDDNGFTNITITDRGAGFPELWGCGNDDGAHYVASATNSNGKQVRMLVCCGGFGSLKSCTIRSR